MMLQGPEPPLSRPLASTPAASLGTSLPPEIASFFCGPYPKTLTVRGVPGSGKTSFALSVLGSFEGYRLFLTASVSRNALRAQFPMLGSPSAPAVDILESHRFQVPSRPPTGRASSAREAPTLPPALQEALAAHADQHAMVVIDSWEAWMENLLGPGPLPGERPWRRPDLESAVLGQIVRTGAEVLLVTERVEPNRFDYVADGGVSLSAAELEGRQERWIFLPKLRGTRIENVSYPFTLEGGRFRCLLPHRPSQGPILPRASPDPEPSNENLWPGSTAFARWFGRVPPQRSTLIEADSEVSERTLWNLTLPIVLSVLGDRGKAAIRPPGSLSSLEVWESIRTAAPLEDLTSHLRIIPPTLRTLPSGVPRGVVFGPADRLRSYLTEEDSEPRSFSEILWREISTFLLSGAQEGTSRDLVLAFPESGLHASVNEVGERSDPLLNLPPEGALVRAGFAAILVMRSDDPSIGHIRTRSALHLMARTVRGQPFLYGIRPWTPLLVPTPLPAGADPAEPYDLVPVV